MEACYDRSPAMTSYTTEDVLPDGGAGGASTGWSLWVAHGHLAAGEDPLVVTRGMVAVGREPDPRRRTSLVLDDRRTSRRHALFTASIDVLRVDDQGARNGVLVNGERVQSATLTAGDVVRVGDSVLVVDRGPAADDADPGRLLGRSASMGALRALLRRAAPSDLPVLVLGETGTGKELVAQELHDRSGRSGRFVAINCGALSESLVESTLFGHRRGAFTHASSNQAGAFQQADGGTLFLDEVGEMSPAGPAASGTSGRWRCPRRASR